MVNIWAEIAIQTLGLLGFLYITWRRLKDDYIGSQIFNLIFFVVLVVGVSTFASSYFYHETTLWIFFLSFIVGNVVGAKRFGLKFMEIFEAEIFAMLFYFTIVFSKLLFVGGIVEIIIFVTFALLIPIFLLIERNYKNFIWYRSGKRGFTSMFTIGLFFLARSLIALVNPSMVFFLQEYDPIFSGIISFISFSVIFYLGGRK